MGLVKIDTIDPADGGTHNPIEDFRAIFKAVRNQTLTPLR